MGVQPKSSERPRAAKSRGRGKAGKASGSRLTRDQIDEIFRRFDAADPNPKTELHYADPFTLLVAVVLSAQATDASVNKATARAVQDSPTPRRSMVELGEAG